MEQQQLQQQLLEPQLPKKHLWVEPNEEEDGEEEVGVGLVARHSRHPIPPSNGDGATLTATPEPEPEPSPASAPTNGNTSELVEEEQQQGKEEEEADESQRNEELSNESGEGNGVANSVYFDKLQGIWKCRHCNWTHQIGSPCILDVQNPKGYLQMAMNTQTLETQGTGSIINGVSETKSEIVESLSREINGHSVKHVEDQNGSDLSPPPVEQFNGESDASLEHFNNATEVDANVDIIEDIEEDSVDLDVERVLEKQNTHDLYCPNCHSCITRRVILRRRKPRVSTKRSKPKPVKKLEPIPTPVSNAHGDSPDPKPTRGKKLEPIPTLSGVRGDTPGIDSDATPTPAPGLQNEQEAFNCLSCFSFFIPIGNGCFKIFQIFRGSERNENTGSPQETGQREITQSPQEINQNQNMQSPQVIDQNVGRETPQGISQNENRKTPQNLSSIGETQSSQKRIPEESTSSHQHMSQNEDAQYPQHTSHSEGAQSPQHISGNEDTQSSQSGNEDTQSSQTISHGENKKSPQNIKPSESKQSPPKIPTAKTNWIFSIFAFPKGDTTFGKVDIAAQPTSVQVAAVPALSVNIVENVDDEVLKHKKPGMSNIFSSTSSPPLDHMKAKPTETEPNAGILRRTPGDSEINDLEAGLLPPRIPPRTEVETLSESGTQNEPAGADAGEAREWDILKSIVYGGLIESITSLGVVSSAAGAGADTLNVLALGAANLIGGLILIIHNLRELKNDPPRVASTETNVEEDRYQAQLGRRQNFVLHFFVAILSFIVFGLVPPVVYGFSFRKSDDKDLKLAAVAGASLLCIFFLALGKGHVQKPHTTYFRTVSYYLMLGITASGISYVFGELIRKLLEKLGLFDSTSALSLPFLDTIPSEVGRAFY